MQRGMPLTPSKNKQKRSPQTRRLRAVFSFLLGGLVESGLDPLLVHQPTKARLLEDRLDCRSSVCLGAACAPRRPDVRTRVCAVKRILKITQTCGAEPINRVCIGETS